MRRLTMHVGLPKTATTSIQDSLYLNSAYLKSSFGIDYCADLCKLANKHGTGHHALAWSEFIPNHPHRVAINAQLIKGRLADCDNALLSSEWFSSAKQAEIEKFVNVWQFPEQRTVVLVYRDEFKHVKSRWLQSVKMGHTFISFQDYYFNVYKPGRKTLSQQVSKWRKAGFNITVLSFAELTAKKRDVAISFVCHLY